MKHFYWDLGLAVVAVFAIATPVEAQQSTAPSEYVLRLSPADIDLIGKALGSQPFSEVAPLFQKLRQQVTEQQTLKPSQEPEKK